MIKLITALLITALLVSLFIGSAQDEVKNYENSIPYICSYIESSYGKSCAGIKDPIVVKSRSVSDLHYGFYNKGEPYIFVNAKLTPSKEELTKTHEATHYFLDHSGVSVDRCEGEYVARKVTSLYYGTEYSDSWRMLYRCEKDK